MIKMQKIQSGKKFERKKNMCSVAFESDKLQYLRDDIHL